MKRALLCGASAAVTTIMFGLAAPQAFAADQPNASGSGTTVGEVVVTAEKRGGNLERVPVAVTAFSAAQRELLGIKSIQDLTDFTPGFSYTTFDNRPYMRGVGRQSDNLAIDPGVATYIDGVYAGANASTILQNDSLFIDRVEILRGPQTTLYGQNADGGAINMISRRPTHDMEEEVRAGAANFGKYYIEGVVSGPISDHVRFRVGGNYTTQSGGYYDNLSGSREGGSVAQGGNGTSDHIEAQLEGDFGPKFDWWAKVASNDYAVSYHTETQLGPYGVSEFPNPLMPNQNFGLCSLPQYAGNLNCTTSPDTVVPGSLVTLPGSSALNPANGNIRDFNGDFKSTSNETKDISVAATATYHADGFDVKYIFGYQSFYYDLTAPWVNSQGLSSSVEQYVLQGPAAPTAACTAMFASNLAGCTQNLTVNPAHTDFTFIENDKFWSHEIDFTSTAAGPVQWLGGVYYYGEQYDQPINVLDPNQAQVKAPLALLPAFANLAVPVAANPTGSVYNEYTNLKARSLDVFGQVDWAIDPEWKLTLGLRDSDDTKSGFETFRVILFDLEGFGLGVNTFGANTPAFDATSCPAGTFPGAGPCSISSTTGLAQRALSAHWNAVTGTVNLSWTPDSSTLAYAKYSRGYKEGGFNSGTMAVFPETIPETVDAFEVGYKKTLSRSLQANIDAFYYNYANEQQPLGADVSGVINTVIFNIPKSESYGLEFEGTWRPVDDLTLNLNYAYLVAKVTNTGGKCFEDTADPAAVQPGANISGCPAPIGGVQLQNLTGQILPESPKNKVTFDAYYTWHFDQGSLAASASATWKDATYGSPFNRAYNLAPEYTQVNARLVWKDVKDQYSAILFCDNIFDAKNYDGVFGLNEGVTQANKELIDRVASLTAPRTFGIELQYRFK